MYKLILAFVCFVSSINAFDVSSTAHQNSDKLIILEANEVGERTIQNGWYCDDWSHRAFAVLEIQYDLSLSDGSQIELIATWASSGFAYGAPLFLTWSSLTEISELRDTFYLEAGDEIIFFEPPNENASKMVKNLVYFKIFREGVLVGTYQGWLSV